MPAWRTISLWMDQLDEPLLARPALERDLDVDVAIIGAGYTGLWTAYYLKRQAPGLNIAIIEAQTAGFGASGRNGGWLMGNLLGEDRLLADLSPEQRRASFDLLHGIPDEVAIVLEREGIDCDYRKGGALYCAARYPEQETSLRALSGQALPPGPDRKRLPLAQSRAAGATDPHRQALWRDLRTARRDPSPGQAGAGSGARGGAHGRERSTRTARSPTGSRAACARRKAAVRSRWIVPAVEGYAVTLPPLGRYQLPVQSLIVATEPLSAATWDEIGLSRGQAFSESSRQVTYGQRTADNRLVFGARGGYQFAGKLRHDFDLTRSEVELRRYLFGELFPQLQERANHPCLGRQPGHVPALQAAHAL